MTGSLLTWYVDLAVVHCSCMGSQRLRQRWHVVPLVSLQVVGLHAGEVAALVPTPNHVQVFIQAAGEETGSPEKGRVNQTTSLKQQWQDVWLFTVCVQGRKGRFEISELLIGLLYMLTSCEHLFLYECKRWRQFLLYLYI